MIRNSNLPYSLIFIVLGLCPAFSASGQKDTSGLKADARANRTIIFKAFPSAGYSPETRIGVGVYGIFLFRFYKDTITRKSILDAGTIITQNNQFYILPTWKFYSSANKYNMVGEGVFQYYSEKFFGIGNNSPLSLEETYRHKLVRIDARFQKQFRSSFYAGLHFVYENMFDVTAYDNTGSIAKGEVIGANGSLCSGLGFSAGYDSRNRIMMTSKGTFMDLQTAWFSGKTGSQYSFSLVNLDIRKYITINKKHVLGLQFLSRQIDGIAPFRMLSLLGGPVMMRGYYYGRFRDNDLVAAQAELRYKINKRIYASGFIGGGEVSPDLSALQLKEIRPNAGGGIRYVYDLKEHLDLRIDAGIGTEGNYGIYVTAGEAF